MENVKYRVAGYLRLSREDGDKEESESIGSQRSIITHKLEELGNEYELVDFYIDDGYTGLNTDRPAFQRMIEDVEKGYVNSIITKDLSRLSRNSFEANYYIEKFFLENNVRYISVLDNVDTYIKSSNNDMIQFKTLINDWYSKDISKKVRSGVWARKEKGLYLGSLAPYGYIKDSKNKNQLIIEPERAKIIKRIFNMYDSGIRMSEIAKILKQDKVFCPGYYDYGGSRSGDDYKWRSEAIKRILQNKVYIGHTEYGKKLNLSYKSKKVKLVPRQEWKIVEDTHEAIIDKALFNRVQQKLNLNKKKKHKKFNWMLNGLVFCKECGSKMVLKIKRNSHGEIVSKSIVCVNSTNSNKEIMTLLLDSFTKKVDRTLLVRRLGICAMDTRRNDGICQMDLFTDYDALEKERKLQRALLEVRKKYGTNALLRGFNYMEGGTARERNHQIGGHKS